MTSAFAFFLARSVRNRASRQLRRLRAPRYAIAALVGVGYFVLVLGGWGAGGSHGTTWIHAGRLAGPLVLALFASWWWLWGGHRQGIILTPAETHLLLPAPLTRSRIIGFKIMQAQPALVFSSLIATLFTRGALLPWPVRLLSLWVMFATLHLHQIAASLVHASADEHGRRGLRRNIVPMALFAIAFITLAWSLAAALIDLRAGGGADIGARLREFLAAPGPRVVLAPFRLLLAPTVAPTIAAWSVPFAGALALLAAHFVWVIRSDAAFEETAAAEGERRDRLVAAVRAGGLARARFAARSPTRKLARPWLPLRETGSNAYAILWKNVLYVQRSLRSARGLLAVMIIMTALIGLNGSAADGGVARLLAPLLLAAAAAFTVLGPFAVRNDLRLDLRHIETLRTYPVRSRDLVAAEAAAAVLTLTAPQLLLGTAGLALVALNGSLPPGTAALALIGGVLALPVINALAVLIQNVLALLYPSWIRIGPTDAGGVETVGQNMIVMVGTMLLLIVCALPPLLVGALVGAPLAMLVGPPAVVAGAAAAIAAALGEAVLITMWLGRLYDRTDPVAAGLLR